MTDQWTMPAPPQPIGRFAFWNDALWISTEDYEAEIAPGVRLLVSAGGTSDGASIPKLLQTGFTPRFGRETFAQAWCHDHLYAAELVSREEADAIFHAMLRAGGVNRVKAWAYYAAVRLYGGRVWKRHTPESVEIARTFARLAR